MQSARSLAGSVSWQWCRGCINKDSEGPPLAVWDIFKHKRYRETNLTGTSYLFLVREKYYSMFCYHHCCCQHCSTMWNNFYDDDQLSMTTYFFFLISRRRPGTIDYYTKFIGKDVIFENPLSVPYRRGLFYMISSILYKIIQYIIWHHNIYHENAMQKFGIISHRRLYG